MGFLADKRETGLQDGSEWSYQFAKAKSITKIKIKFLFYFIDDISSATKTAIEMSGESPETRLALYNHCHEKYMRDVVHIIPAGTQDYFQTYIIKETDAERGLYVIDVHMYEGTGANGL